jgi:hypothetical protein
LFVSPCELLKDTRFHSKFGESGQMAGISVLEGPLGPYSALFRVCQTGGWGYNRALQK